MLYKLPSYISNIAYNYSPYSTMSISTVNYHNTFFPKLDITTILDIPTYYALHQMHLELKSNPISVHSNLGGATHGHLGIFVTNMKYATLSPVPYIRPV